MKRLAVAAAMVTVLACGNSPGSSTKPSSAPATPAPSSSPGGDGKAPLFAVLEPGGDPTQMRDTAVAIVRTTGFAAAKARFDPRSLPTVGNALLLNQPEARVAAGKVYFVDGSGAVRSLAPDGTVASVTNLPLSSPQQMLSFAVSPDGSQILATVFGFPPVHVPPPHAATDPPFGPGDFTLQELSAKPGGSPTTLSKRSWPQSTGLPRDALSMAGWTQSAPLVTIDTALATNGGSLGRHLFGHVAELDTAGRPGPPLDGYGCDPWQVLPDETVLCDDDGQQRNFSVRAKDGTVRYRVQASGDTQYLDLALAPDGSRVAYLPDPGNAQVSDSTGKVVQLPASFRPEGWLDPTTVIGVLQTAQGDGDMALVQLAHPTRLQDLGFHGYFVGVL